MTFLLHTRTTDRSQEVGSACNDDDIQSVDGHRVS